MLLLALAGLGRSAAWQQGETARIGVYVHDPPYALLDEAGNITGEPR